MPPLIRGLMTANAYDHPTTTFQKLETHISWVILTGNYAYKLKKPVNLGFVDFTTLDRRRHFCEEEIRLNRRLAPELYLGVRPIYGSVEKPTFAAHGVPIEYAVQMRQFNQDSLLTAVLKRGELHPDHFDRLAVLLAEFHQRALIADDASPYGTPDAVLAPATANINSLKSSELPTQQAATIQALENWTDLEYRRLRTWFQERHDTGRVRECHGDLHLGNMVLLTDDIRPFDCLEFNPELRWIDVISEIAFLVMDLQEHGRSDLAFRLLNRWLEQLGDYDSLTGWKWYLAYRALVRAKVAALRLRQPDVDAEERTGKQKEVAKYIELAAQSVQTRRTGIILMSGVSGSGKSHVARWISEQFGTIQIRSDVERKRLFGKWGMSGDRQLSGDMYSPKVTQSLYREVLAGLVPGILEAEFSVVIDATCLRRWQRSVFLELAERIGMNCLILDVQAGQETMRQRLRNRQASGGDPSDANHEVLNLQLAHREGLTEAERLQSFSVDTESLNWQESLASKLQRFLSTDRN